MTVTTMKMSHAEDPADVIRKELGNLDNVDVFHNLILIGIYKRPDKTAGGIIITPKTQSEEVYQGTVGLVLKVGPGAFKDDANNSFHGQSVKPGDWVCYKNSDAHRIAVNGVNCRLLEDSLVKLKVGHPDQVF